MAELGTRFTIERVKIGHSLPKAARACALLGEADPHALAQLEGIRRRDAHQLVNGPPPRPGRDARGAAPFAARRWGSPTPTSP